MCSYAREFCFFGMVEFNSWFKPSAQWTAKKHSHGITSQNFQKIHTYKHTYTERIPGLGNNLSLCLLCNCLMSSVGKFPIKRISFNWYWSRWIWWCGMRPLRKFYSSTLKILNKVQKVAFIYNNTTQNEEKGFKIVFKS